MIESKNYSESSLVEQLAVALSPTSAGIPGTASGRHIIMVSLYRSGDLLGVVLVSQLLSAPLRLNPELSREALELTVEALIQDRSTISAAKANQG